MTASQLISCVLLSLVMWAGFGTGYAVVGEIITAQEDDAFANCHVYGNGECGPNAPWHGFVNGFKHADY